MSTQKSSKKKVVAIAITTVALTASSFGVANATQKSTKVTRTSVSTISNPGQAGKPDRSAELSALLSTLVAKATITQAQADAIVAAAKSAEAARDALRPSKDGMKDDRGDKDGRGHGGMKGDRGPGRGKGGPMGGAPVIPAPTPTTSTN